MGGEWELKEGMEGGICGERKYVNGRNRVEMGIGMGGGIGRWKEGAMMGSAGMVGIEG